MPTSKFPTTAEILDSIPTDLRPVWARLERITSIRDPEIRLTKLRTFAADLSALNQDQAEVQDLTVDVAILIKQEELHAKESEVALENSPAPLPEGCIILEGPSIRHGMGPEGFE